MAKEKTILINMRIPESLLIEFDVEVAKDVLVASRTALVINCMDGYINKRKRLRKNKE